MSALQQQQMALVQQAGNLIGQMLRKSLFGDPEQEAQRLAQEQAAIEQQRRIAEEQERHMEEAKNRLLAMMIGIGPANDLKPIGVGSANDLQPIGLGGAPDLQPMLGTGAPPPPATLANLPASSAMAQMTSAVYYSELAAKATTDEDAAVLADAAFSMTLGMPVNIPVPPATQALAVQNSDMPRIEAVRNDYRDAMKSVDDSLEKINNLEQQRTLVQQVLNDNQARLTDAERKTANDQARSLVASLDEQIVRERAIANTAQGRLSNATGGALELLGEFMQRKQGGRASVRYQYATSSPRNDVAPAPKPASERKDERKPPDRQEQPDRPEPPDAFVRESGGRLSLPDEESRFLLRRVAGSADSEVRRQLQQWLPRRRNPEGKQAARGLHHRPGSPAEQQSESRLRRSQISGAVPPVLAGGVQQRNAGDAFYDDWEMRLSSLVFPFVDLVLRRACVWCVRLELKIAIH